MSSFKCIHVPLQKAVRSYRTMLLILAASAIQSLSPAAVFSETAPEPFLKQHTQQVSETPRPFTDSMQKFFSNVTRYFGTHYRSGGQTPAGFDCSGFVRFMFGKTFDMELPRSSTEMAAIGTKVNKDDLQPGDLVFFQTKGRRINHVGIFIGNDTFIHSSLSKGITEDRLNHSYFEKRFAGAVRVLDPATAKSPALPVKTKETKAQGEAS